jgi:hypothetical protein
MRRDDYHKAIPFAIFTPAYEALDPPCGFEFSDGHITQVTPGSTTSVQWVRPRSDSSRLAGCSHSTRLTNVSRIDESEQPTLPQAVRKRWLAKRCRFLPQRRNQKDAGSTEICDCGITRHAAPRPSRFASRRSPVRSRHAPPSRRPRIRRNPAWIVGFRALGPSSRSRPLTTARAGSSLARNWRARCGRPFHPASRLQSP